MSDHTTVKGPTELDRDSFSILTADDVSVIEAALTAAPDETDYSEFYDADETALPE